MRRVALFLALLALAATPSLAAPPCPFAPPVTSPGPNYPPDAPAPPIPLTTITREDQTSYCLYTPPGVVRGIVLYVHGFQFIEQGGLDPMLQYIANAGYYVVYPYDNPLVTPTAAKSALAASLAYLQQKGVSTQNLAVAGYSAGGMAAVRVAATWVGPPNITAIIVHDPAGTSFLTGPDWDLSVNALASIPCKTHLLIVQSQTSVGDSNSAAGAIWDGLPQISRYTASMLSPYRRNFLRVPDDTSHPNPPSTSYWQSDHLTVLAAPPQQVLGSPPSYLTYMDFYGYWRPFRTALARVFEVKNSWVLYATPYCNALSTVTYCRGIRYMGTWSSPPGAATAMSNATDLNFFPSPVIPDYCP
jgi:hypothetical protein